MKCDELKPLVFSLNELSFIDESAVQMNFENPHDHAVYKATEVDDAIAELKQKLQDQCISCPVKMQEDDVVAEKDNENRRLKRALWIARAELCRRLDVDRYLRKHINSWYNENCLTWAEACVAMEVKMCKAESKCRAKAEEYK